MSVAYAEVLLDAHVHYHEGFSRPAFFDAARRNLAAGARELGLPETVGRGLMFTESAGVDVFGELAAISSTNPAPANEWTFRSTEEDNSLWALPPGETVPPQGRILLIAGRQIVTRDGLEVLALGCRTPIPDGMSLQRARDSVIENNGVPVVPWGFGKWWFARGRLLAQLLAAGSPGTWFVGDNAGRPRLAPRPPLFARAAENGVFVLPGSDPLPLSGQEGKPGRCGLHLLAEIDRARPAASVLAALRALDAQPSTFGRYERLPAFARDQLAMQRRKRANAPEPAT